MSESVQLSVKGMKCGGCETNVRGKLEELPGVESVVASHKENSVSVEFDSQQTDLEMVKAVIKKAGFTVE